ncbi:MAG: hypothetical protein ACT4PM_04205 [Gemmatimonadales bacterium]
MPFSGNRCPRFGAMLLLSAAAACSDDTGPSDDLPARTFRMGFSAFPPRANEQDLLAALELWTRRADAAIMHLSVPYKAMLTGTGATTYVNTVDLPLANYFRAKSLPITVTLDLTDGLNRSAEAPDLIELGRSITEPEVQQKYREYAVAVATIIQPVYLGLAAETNLIRGAAPPALYAALVTMTNAAAAHLAALPAPRPVLYVSVQVEDAWGALLPGGSYQGVERDFQDFPFIAALGLSSYPYFVYPDPEQIPLDYYARLRSGRSIPLLVVEGGWTSGSVGTITSSPAVQARYLRRHEQLLDSARAIAVFQLTFTDLDVASFNLPPGSILPLFAQLGLVDDDLVPKPALATYDSIFGRPRR